MINIKSKIKVLHVVSELGTGGVEQVLYNYYKNIDRDNIEFDFIVHGYNKGILESEFKILGSKVYHVVPKNQNFIQNYRQIKEIINTKNYDIIQCHQNFSSIIPLYVGYKKGIKVRIAHSHVSDIKKSIHKKIMSEVIKIVANNYCACGSSAGEYLFGKKKCRDLFIMRNAIEVDKFKYDLELRNKIRANLNLNDKIVIGHVGRFSEEKNHEFLIKLLKELVEVNDKFTLCLIGEGPLKEKIKSMVNQCNLSNNVIFIGHTSYVYEYMQAMDIFLLPSHYEGFGMVLLEAQCAGLKCIASNTISKDSQVTNNIVFKEIDIYQWKECILQLSEGYSRECNYFKISQSGFDIKEESQRLEEYYEKLIMKEMLI
ncbi:glycosyltransferase family 1 protein [Paraclostridium tenue]